MSFTLAQNAYISMGIYNISGYPLYNEQWNNVPEGEQTKSLVLDAAPGYYILKLTYGNEVKTTLLIKK